MNKDAGWRTRTRLVGVSSLCVRRHPMPHSSSARWGQKSRREGPARNQAL